MEKWFVTTKKADFAEIAEAFGIHPVTARIIRNRDIIGKEEINYYLNGTKEMLYNPRNMKDMEKAVSILQEKIRQRKKIRIIGDYDIDGVNASHILYTGLMECGAVVDIEIPDRMKDGYGINRNLIKAAEEEKVDTILTCDNGIAAIEEVQYAKELGMTVVVTDHHDIPYRLVEGEKEILKSEADAVVNPKQESCPYPFKELCGAAIAYKMVQVLYEEEGIPMENWEDLMQFAAFATIGDVMELVGENRILVKEGLRRLGKTTNYGLRALIEAHGLDGKTLTTYHVGFVLGPCINASGRLDTAKRALELLQADSLEKGAKLAGDLKALNDSRKDMTAKGLEKAVELIENGEAGKDRVLVMYLQDCHESLAGIIAGRIRERYYKPVFVLTKGAEGVKGSGRSIEAYSMFEEMTKCRELFSKYGGHPMAAGLSMPEENIEPFRKALNQNTQLTEEDMAEKVSIDVPMPIQFITKELIYDLKKLEPFGKGNPKPVFAEKDLHILQARVLGKNRNVLKLQLQNSTGMKIDGMYFGNIERFDSYIEEKFGSSQKSLLYAGRYNDVRLSAVYYPEINEYMGCESLQIIIQHYQ